MKASMMSTTTMTTMAAMRPAEIFFFFFFLVTFVVVARVTRGEALASERRYTPIRRAWLIMVFAR